MPERKRERKQIGQDLINTLQPEGKDYWVDDTLVKGFKLRVHPTGRKVFYCEYARNKRYQIGTTEQIKAKRAREIAEDVIINFKKGKDPKPTKSLVCPSLRQFIDPKIKDSYGEYAKAHLKTWDSTLKRITSSFSEYLDFKLSDITTAKLDRRWRTARKTKGCKPSTINRDIVCIKRVFSKAAEWNVIPENHLKDLSRETIDNAPKTRFLSPEEEGSLRSALIQRADKMRQERERYNQWREERGYPLFPNLSKVRFVDHLEPMVLLSISTGMRRGELFNLKWENIDFRNRSITVEGSTSKTSQTRHIPFNDDTNDLLKEWQKQKSKKTGLVFPNSEGKPFDHVNSSWRNLLQLAGIENFRWHDMRHHFASVLVMNGVDLNTVRELLGHSDIKQTLRYAHLARSHKANAVKALQNWASEKT